MMVCEIEYNTDGFFQRVGMADIVIDYTKYDESKQRSSQQRNKHRNTCAYPQVSLFRCFLSRARRIGVPWFLVIVLRHLHEIQSDPSNDTLETRATRTTAPTNTKNRPFTPRQRSYSKCCKLYHRVSN